MASAEPEGGTGLLAEDLRDAWPALDLDERLEGFRLLDPGEAESLLEGLEAREQCGLLLALNPAERQLWMRQLAPDDAADAVQAAAPEQREALLVALDAPTRREVSALLAYAEDEAGGLMSPRYVRLRPDMRWTRRWPICAEPRASASRRSTTSTCSTRSSAWSAWSPSAICSPRAGDARVRDVMRGNVISVRDDLDQEAVAHVIAENGLMAVPVLDAEGRICGIVTVDDIVDVVREEATEDIQKIGGTQALDAPYLEVGLLEMVRKRGVWLTVIFVGPAAHHDGDEPVRGRARACGGAGALHSAGDLERRQLGLAGQHARDPRHGDAGGAAARLVARAAPRDRRRPAARPRARRDRPAAHRALAAAQTSSSASTSSWSASPWR